MVDGTASTGEFACWGDCTNGDIMSCSCVGVHIHFILDVFRCTTVKHSQLGKGGQVVWVRHDTDCYTGLARRGCCKPERKRHACERVDIGQRHPTVNTTQTKVRTAVVNRLRRFGGDIGVERREIQQWEIQSCIRFG